MANNMNNNGIITTNSDVIVVPQNDIRVVDTNNNLSDIIDINAVGEPKKRKVTYAVPSWAAVMRNVPKKPDYRKEGRINVNQFGTLDISGMKGATAEEVMAGIGADFKAIPEYNPRTNPITGEVVQIKNPILINSKTGNEICQSTPTYKVIDFDESIYMFFSLLEEIKKHGYIATPAVSKLYNNDASLFLQYQITGGDIVGDEVNTYLTLLTSHDATASMTIALSAVRLFCQNQIHRCLNDADNMIKIRHSTIGQQTVRSAISEKYQAAIATGRDKAAAVINMIEGNMFTLNAYLKQLSEIKIEDKDIFRTQLALRGYKEGEEITQRGATLLENETAGIMACYGMPDVDKVRGTALGAYYAYSDYIDHVGLANQDGITKFENAMSSTGKLAKFADTLVAVVNG